MTKCDVRSEETVTNAFIEHEDLKQANLCTEEEREAIRQKALADSCIVEPLIVWGTKKFIVWGYEELAIAREHKLPYEIKEIEFESVADCLAWIGEKRLSIPSLNDFQKTEIGLEFWEFWKDKDEAKYGAKSPLKIAAKEKSGRADKSAIVGVKAGISHNSVYKVCRILESENMKLIEDCRSGEKTISAAYNLINGGKVNDEDDGSDDETSAEDKKTQRNKKQKQKEVDALAKYCSEGFASKKEKLDEHGLKFFVLRWNEEHPKNKINSKQVEKAIDVLVKEKK